MNKQLKTLLIVFGSIVVGVGAIAFGALTSPSRQAAQQQQSSKVASSPIPSPGQKPKPSQTPQKTPPPSSTPQKKDLKKQLEIEQPIITAALLAAYPKIASDYAINQGQLFENGQWYGTTLTYRGGDAMNRDTLRVLLQKKDDTWVLRTTPPELLLSAKKYPDVPKKVLQTINKAISLPGTDTSPTITAAE